MNDRSPDISKFGGKGASLLHLKALGMNVPDFVVIGTDQFDLFSKTGDWSEVEALKTIESWGDIELAVRSSSTLEDSEKKSFAGLFKTVLGVRRANLKSAVIEVFESAKLVSASYSTSQGKIAVVIQKLIRPDHAGVAFSRRPIGNSSLVLVESVKGLGESLVSGEAIANRFDFDRFGNLVEARASTSAPAISHLREIFKKTMELEQCFGFPVDVEWCYRGEELFVLQARPITKTFSALNYYCDTNLVESYPGFTSPLTSDVVKHVYYRIFHDSAKFLGASERRLEILDGFYRNMIGSFFGHLYYNMNSYYAALTALPGGDKNLSAWHKMIGAKDTVAVPQVRFPSFSPVEIVRILIAFLKIIFFHSLRVERFRKQCADFFEIKKQAIGRCSHSRESARLLHAALNPEFGLDVIPLNDFKLMKLVEKKLKKNPTDKTFLKTGALLSSLEPERELARLASNFSKAAFADYLAKFGDRAFEDLKLESKVFKEHPDLLKKWMDASMSRPPENNLSIGAPKSSLSKCIAYREELRLLRSRYFGVLRAIVRRTASLLSRELDLNEAIVLEKLWGSGLQLFQDYGSGKISATTFLILSRDNWRGPEMSHPEYFCHPVEHGVTPYVSSLEELSENDLCMLRGDGASAGRMRGIAKVVLNPQEVEPGEITKDTILVSRCTDPAWVFLMARAGGLITERGSLLSHTAIIGRELGLPTVVAVKNATDWIQDGDRLEIDGATGEITKLNAPESSEKILREIHT